MRKSRELLTSIDMLPKAPCKLCGAEMLVESKFHELGACWKCARLVAAAYVEYHTGEPDPRLDREGYERYMATRRPPAYAKVKIPEELRWDVFKRDGFACVHCSSQLRLRADHIHPERLGGKATLENLQTLCHRCNSRKGGRHE